MSCHCWLCLVVSLNSQFSFQCSDPTVILVDLGVENGRLRSETEKGREDTVGCPGLSAG